MNLRTLQTAHPFIRGAAIGIALCLAPAISAQTPTTLVTSAVQKEVRSSWSQFIAPGGTVNVSVPYGTGSTPTGNLIAKYLVIDNISLTVGGSTAQTYLVQFAVTSAGSPSSPVVYYYLLSPTTTFAGNVPMGVLNQSTKIRMAPGDTLTVSFNGISTTPTTVEGTISGYYAPYNTSLPF